MSQHPQSLREEIRTKDMWALMWKLTPVAVIAMSINSINTFVDALFIGQFLGEKALAAVSLAFPLSFFANAFAAMLGIGGASLLSISIGNKNYDFQKKIFGTVALLSIIVSLLLTLFGWTFAEDMIAAIGGQGEVLTLGTAYYSTIVLGSIFQIFAVAVNMLIRAEGKIQTAMYIAMFSMIANMVLNPLFIGYFGMGIEGAAYATILSMVLFTVLDLWYFYSKRTSYQVDLNYFKLDKALVRPILNVGVSAMMLQLMFIVQQVAAFKMLDIYGDDWDIAFLGACYRILILMLVPGFGFSSAMQPVSGINFGAGDYERVKEAFFKFTIGSTILTTGLQLIFMFFPTFILGMMLPDATFTSADIRNFRIMISPGFMFSAFFMGVVLYQSIGNAKTAGIVMIMREIVFYLPFVLIFPIFWGVLGIYLVTPVQNIIVLVITIYLLRKTFLGWKKKVD